jgi:hypothetical protein
LNLLSGYSRAALKPINSKRNALFLALLSAWYNLKTSGLHTSVVSRASGSSRSGYGGRVAGTSLLGNFTPTATISSLVIGLLLNDSTFSKLLAANELLGEMTTVHRGRVAVNSVSNQTSVER